MWLQVQSRSYGPLVSAPASESKQQQYGTIMNHLQNKGLYFRGAIGNPLVNTLQVFFFRGVSGFGVKATLAGEAYVGV